MYRVVYAILYLISLLPYRILYFFSDFFFIVIYYGLRYRRTVVMSNLKIAFPEKSQLELDRIALQFYRDFVDNFIEMIKLLSISKTELLRHLSVDNEVLLEAESEGKNIYLVLGHFFNWELANQAYAAAASHHFLVAYMPLENKLLDKVIIKLRSRFGSHLLRATKFRHDFRAQGNKEPYTLVLVADQNPGSPEHALWTDFFGQKIPFVTGPEAARLGQNMVVFGHIYKERRGHYHSKLFIFSRDASKLKKGEITKGMSSFFEEAIRKHPCSYLWSHRRWKYVYDAEKYGKLLIRD